MKLQKLDKFLSIGHTIFLVLCILIWISAYVMMIIIAGSVEIPPTLGVLILALPIGSFVLSQVVVLYRKNNAPSPNAISNSDDLSTPKQSSGKE